MNHRSTLSSNLPVGSRLYNPLRLVFAFSTILFSLGCGPVLSSSAIGDAQVAIERARASRADELAPYEYYKARYFLYKSKEEWGYSAFEASKDFAEAAKKSADIALIKAKEDPWKGSPSDPERTPESMKDTGNSNKMLGVDK